MRKHPLLGDKFWFGPRQRGWGWTPVSWEGWIAFAFLLVLYLSSFRFVRVEWMRLVITAIFMVAVTVICLLKGTSPGGPKAARARRSS